MIIFDQHKAVLFLFNKLSSVEIGLSHSKSNGEKFCKSVKIETEKEMTISIYLHIFSLWDKVILD